MNYAGALYPHTTLPSIPPRIRSVLSVRSKPSGCWKPAEDGVGPSATQSRFGRLVARASAMWSGGPGAVRYAQRAPSEGGRA